MLRMDPRDEPGRGEAAPPAEVEHDSTLTYDPVDEARRVRAREAAAGIPDLRGFALVVADGPMRGAHWHLGEGTHEAGRNTAATVFLDDITVSRRHAEVRKDGDEYFASDVGSLNGTYLNRERITSPVPLANGDELQIGKYKLVFFMGAGDA